MSIEITIKGADHNDTGPKGVIVRYLEAVAAQDGTALSACLTEESRKIYGLEQTALTDCTVTVDEVITEGDMFVVPTTTVDANGSDEFSFVVREESGELRMDMNATMAKAMGVSPDALMDHMMEQMGDAISGDSTETLESGVDAIQEDSGEPEETDEQKPVSFSQGHWVLSPEALVDFPERILQAAWVFGSLISPPFTPPMEELDTEQYGTEEAQVKTTRYGESERWFSVTENLAAGEGFSTHSVTVDGFGMPAGQNLRVVWTAHSSEGETTNENVIVTANLPEDSLKAIEGFISEEFGHMG